MKNKVILFSITFMISIILFSTTSYAFLGVIETIDSYIESFSRWFVMGLYNIINPTADDISVTHISVLDRVGEDIDERMIGIIEESGDSFGHIYKEDMPEFVINIWLGGNYAEDEEEAEDLLFPVVTTTDPLNNFFVVSIDEVGVGMEEAISCQEAEEAFLDGYWCTLTVLLEEDVKLYGDYETKIDLGIWDNGDVDYVDEFEFTVTDLVEITKPEHTDVYTIDDLPITIEYKLDGVNQFRVCTIGDEDSPIILEEEYCNVYATYDREWWDFFGIITEEPSCEAIGNYPDYDIEDGDVIHPQYCEADFVKRPHNRIDIDLIHRDTGNRVSLDSPVGLHQGDGLHETTIKHKHLLELTNVENLEEDGFFWGEFYLELTFADLGSSVFWDGIARTFITKIYK